MPVCWIKVILQILHKISCYGNVPKGIKKCPNRENSCKYLSFAEKIMKIGPVDPDIALLMLKKNNASKIYTPSGKFTERAKWFLINFY